MKHPSYDWPNYVSRVLGQLTSVSATPRSEISPGTKGAVSYLREGTLPRTKRGIVARLRKLNLTATKATRKDAINLYRFSVYIMGALERLIRVIGAVSSVYFNPLPPALRGNYTRSQSAVGNHPHGD